MHRGNNDKKLNVYFQMPEEIKSRDPENFLSEHLLGRMLFGVHGFVDGASAASKAATQYVRMQVLSPVATWSEEIWSTQEKIQTVSGDNLQCQFTDDVLFGVVEFDETMFDVSKNSTHVLHQLERLTELAYTKLFKVLDQYNFPYLWRTWNYVADINTVTEGVERYQQFNAGRQKGFASSARGVTGNVPAACALGVRGQHLSIAFLAGRTPSLALENPRQISAYNYPEQYGVLRPTFSRASLAIVNNQEFFLLSGTASIVGHETLHKGDIRRQTLETITNIQTMIEQANKHSSAAHAYAIQDLLLRVYVRNVQDVPTIKQVLDEHMGVHHQAIYLHADICRSDLDVEIEGMGIKPVSESAKF